MRCLEPSVVDVVWHAVEGLIPTRHVEHPLGCHRPRIPDRVCFTVMLTKLVTGRSWWWCARQHGIDDRCVRDRRDEWAAAGVFDALCDEAIAAYDRIVGLSLDDVLVDGSLARAPNAREVGPNPCDRGKRGWKWSIATDAAGIPVSVIAAGANVADTALLASTLDAATGRGLLEPGAVVHLDRGYDNRPARAQLTARGLEWEIARRRPRAKTRRRSKHVPLQARWPVERTNAWLHHFGQLDRNTDRTDRHRLGWLHLAIVLLLAARLVAWARRWA